MVEERPAARSEHEVGAVVASLQGVGQGLPEAGLRAAVERNLARLRSAPVQDYVPLLVEHQVRSELLVLSRAGTQTRSLPRESR
jgi:hypothetical protein